MKRMLGDSYPDFEKALGDSAVRAVRLNNLKGDSGSFLKEPGYILSRIPYTERGYIVRSGGEGIGNTPYHHAGAFYVQDPGAMISAEATEITPGMLVCDLCAAPGGKTTQIAEKLCGKGFLLSNEFVPKRAKILVGNIERLGIRNAAVTSLDTAVLADLYDSFFDVVIADAPCSGEGMFRKGDTAREEWSEENVAICAERQAYILDNAAKMVKGGGRIVYSTCTYSLEENEMAVDAFLKRHPDFRLTEATERIVKASSDGISFDGATCGDLSLTRRFYPHVSEGEGQFVAVLLRDGGGASGVSFKNALKVPDKTTLKLVADFFKENLTEVPDGKVALYNDNLVLVSHDVPIPQSSVFSAGVLIGEVRGKVLVPHHQFFSAYGDLFVKKEELSLADAERYLAGEELEAKELISAGGFCALTYHGITLGGGKVSSGRIKNHYPKGLRKN